jgi:glycosyltransferase involved in cell wall biosynthesis
MYGIHVLHARGWATLVEAALASKLARVRGSLYAFHGRTYDELQRRNIKRQIIQSLFVRSYDRVVTLNSLMKKEFSRECRLREDKIDVIANGIELDRFSPSSNRSALRKAHGIPLDRFVIGNVGRLDPVKNQETLLRAVYGLRQRGRRPYLIIVGEGQSRGALENLTDGLGLREDVCLYGFSDRVPELLNCMDLYVQSSLYEGSSHTLVEAMACGVPVVATDVGGTADLFEDGREGFRVNPWDENALLELIAKIQDDPQLRRTLGLQARDRACKLFSVEMMVSRYEQLYHELATLR